MKPISTTAKNMVFFAILVLRLKCMLNLARRCNGTTAGLGYLEVIWIVLEKVLHGQ